MSVSATRRAGHVFGGNYGDDVDVSRWVVIYPPYIDSTRKVSEVRKHMRMVEERQVVNRNERDAGTQNWEGEMRE